MSMTTRGRTALAAAAAVAVVAVVVAVLVLGGGKGLSGASPRGPGSEPSAPASPRPTVCPLTGAKPPHGAVPIRPALAVKVENLPAARPQTGLSFADVIYEEPVEAGITRFIVVYQCQDAERIEPVRSARLTDPSILVQYGRPLFGYAGGVQKVINAVADAKLIDVNYIKAGTAYHRDDARIAPHNLYTSTRALYQAGHAGAVLPPAVFTFDPTVPSSASSATSVHVPFSGDSDVFWRWSSGGHQWLRSYGSTPATYSDGSQIGSTNVVIQSVKVVMTDITDVNGVHSPEVISTGSGTCYVLRDGGMIKGTWSRPSASDVTVFKDSHGDPIPLAPGRTWVELVPNTIHVSFG